jgi:hypothetical protein
MAGASQRWKEVERQLAKWIGGDAHRIASRGVAEADVLSEDYTFESKSRAVAGFPNWLLGAFDQSEVQHRIYPDKENFVFLAVHYGRGNPMRFFIAREVDFKTDEAPKFLGLVLEASAFAANDLTRIAALAQASEPAESEAA